jgi:hypothetical protein
VAKNSPAIAGFSQTTDAIIEITGLTGILGLTNFVIAEFYF